MSPEQFFNIFLVELKDLPELSHYYKFLSSEKDLEFRKNYFIQRLTYLQIQVEGYKKSTNVHPAIWDCGCGYGTSCLFLAMNGFKTYGSTLEFYIEFLEKRKEFWAQYGDSGLFEYGYEDIISNHPTNNTIDIIILQDTLHHLEPIDIAISIFANVVKKGGILICIEENGDNLIQNFKLYKQRGNKKIITYWDENLNKEITMGNENIRSVAIWTSLFTKASLIVDESKTQFIRLLPPIFYKNKKANDLALLEEKLTNKFLTRFFYFGINFIVRKK